MKELLPDWNITTSTGGLNLWVEVPIAINTALLANDLRQLGIVIEPGEPFFINSTNKHHFIKLGFILLNEEKLRSGLELIASFLKKKQSIQ
jgi:GntR family transcriptional regulator/MocR family aminotransferase